MTISDDDVKVWRERASPVGGQVVGYNPGHIWVKHIHSGIQVRIPEHLARSQHRSRRLALLMLEFALIEIGWR